MNDTLSGMADYALKFFEQAERSNGDKFYRTKDQTPEWITDLIREAHGERFPDDWIYKAVVEVLNELSDSDYETVEDADDVRSELVDGLVDVYTASLTAWLASDVRNVYYLGEAMEPEPRDGFQLLGMAQYHAYDEVFGAVLTALGNRLEEVA
jgi:hypothetical protein